MIYGHIEQLIKIFWSSENTITEWELLWAFVVTDSCFQDKLYIDV